MTGLRASIKSDHWQSLPEFSFDVFSFSEIIKAEENFFALIKKCVLFPLPLETGLAM